ncbi:hypothetical protein N9875_01340, partial [bacterium]|nr:hypothetical protein [bacterium]
TYGAGADLQIYHDGSSSYIKDAGTGDLILSGANIRISNVADSQNHIRCADGADVKLYYAGNDKLQTTSTGIDVTGDISSTTGADLATSSGQVVVGAAGSTWSAAKMVIAEGTGAATSGHSSIIIGNTNNSTSSERGAGVLIGSTNAAAGGADFSDIYFAHRNNAGNGEGTVSRISSYKTSGADTSDLRLYTTNAERMRITSGGHIGIGTTSAAHKLSIGGGSDSRIHLGYNATSANTETGRISTNSYDVNNESYSLAEMSFVTSSANGYTGGIQFRTNSANSTNSRAAVRMTILADGKVGIGTASPASVLEISDASSPVLRVTDSDNSNTAFIQADGTNAAYFGTLTNHDVRIAPNNSTKVIIKTDGKVGIGVAAPAELLHVESAANSTKIRIKNTKSGDTTGAELEMVNEDGTWQLGTGRGSLHNGADEDFHIYRGGTRLWIKASDGNVYIPSGNLKFETSGKGIDFSANSNAGGMSSELLDSYEEGTWTLTDQSGASLSLSVYVAMYTKIGRKVFFEIGMAFPTTSSTAIPRLSLPFTAKGGDDNTGIASTSGTNSGRENDYWLVSRGQAYFQVGNSLNSDTHSTQAKNDDYSGKQLKLCGSYTV